MKLQRDSLISLVIGIVLIGLLTLLAALQYRWLGQLSEGSREQMKAHLGATANRVSHDFDAELTQLVGTFYVPTNQLNDETRYAEKYQQWLDSTQHARLLKNIFIARLQTQDQLLLRQFNPQTKQFTDQQWAPEVLPLQTLLQERVSNYRQFTARREPGPPPLPPQIFDSELPAFIIPIMQFTAPLNDARPELLGYAILQLDLSYLQLEVLPKLLKSHFVNEDMANYDFAVVTREQPRQMIWQSSNSTFDLQATMNADASEPMFGVLGEEIRKMMRNRIESRGATRPRIGGFLSLRNEEKGWELLIRHRTGSLDTAVGQIRHRNLLVSFSILLMLLTSVILLALTTRRAKKLAQQQMDFVAGVSHELRTPLSVIDSAAYNLTKGVIKEPPQLERYGNLIRKETSRLKDMIEQMLEFAGVQSGRQKYELHRVDVPELIESVLASTQPLLTEGKFIVAKEIAPTLPPVLADAPALGRALQNLISNAMKYGGADRWIGIQAQAITNGKGPEIQITVADHGIGINAEEQQLIFEPFFRGSEVRSAQIHGNGLGLSLVKNIVTAHHGQIHVASQDGQGSKFTLSLPALVEQ